MKKLGIISIMGVLLIGLTSCGVSNKATLSESTTEVEISEASDIMDNVQLATADATPTYTFTEEDYNDFKDVMNSFTSMTCLQLNILEADGVEVNSQKLDITCDLGNKVVEWKINDGELNKFDGKENIYYKADEHGELQENFGSIPTLGFNVNKLDGMWGLFEYLVGSDAKELIGVAGEITDDGYEYYKFTKKASDKDILGVDYDSLDDSIVYTYIFKDGVPVSINASMGYVKDGTNYTTRTSLQFNNLKIGDEENAVK